MSVDPLALLDQLDALRADAHDGPWERNETWTRWVDDEDGSLIAEAQSPADAALIVAAVNALPKLTTALRAVLDAVNEWERTGSRGGAPELPRQLVVNVVRGVIAAALTPEQVQP